MKIAFTVGGRDDYLRETLESWREVPESGESYLHFMCEPDAGDAITRCSGVTWAREAVTEVNPERYGVSRNPWHALERIFGGGADFVVLAEEDTPVSADVLEYFSWARDTYAADKTVAAVCAHQIRVPQGTPEEAFRLTWFSPVVWGLWADRWREHFRDTWDFDYSHHGWDANFLRVMRERNLTAMFPARSRSQHIGEHGGAHCTPEFFPLTLSLSFASDHHRQGPFREVEPPADCLDGL